MATSSNTWRHDWVVMPGEILLEALEDRDMSQSDLARRMGRPIKTINEIVNGKASITPDTAIQLELTLGITADFWINLEAAYRAQLARARSEKMLSTYAAWATAFPVKDLTRHNLIEQEPDPAATVAALLRFFRVSSPDAWETQWLSPAAVFRASPTYKSQPHAASAWLRWGELLAEEISTTPFDATRLEAIISDVRALSRQDLALSRQRLDDLLASVGVALVLTPEFKGVRLSGAARWITPDKALIQLSLRHKTDDQLWFTLFHEIRHLLHRKKVDFVDDEKSSAQDADELDADQFARDTLIPPNAYADLIGVSTITAQIIREFAKNQGISPGIVVGRLQRDSYIPRSHFNDLKKPITFGT
jgi:HTH-type transcriptional regulator / antitoxin HigA